MNGYKIIGGDCRKCGAKRKTITTCPHKHWNIGDELYIGDLKGHNKYPYNYEISNLNKKEVKYVKCPKCGKKYTETEAAKLTECISEECKKLREKKSEYNKKEVKYVKCPKCGKKYTETEAAKLTECISVECKKLRKKKVTEEETIIIDQNTINKNRILESKHFVKEMYEKGRVQQIENIKTPNKITPSTKFMIPNLLNQRGVDVVKINQVINKIRSGEINTIVGPYLIYKYKLNNKNIILVGENHHNLSVSLKYNEIYFMDLFKLQLLRDNNQCYDLFVEQKLKHLTDSWYESGIDNNQVRVNTLEGGYSKLFKSKNYKNIVNSDFSSLENWLIDDDLVKCSSHFIPETSNLPITEECPFYNLRYHNVDLRLLCQKFLNIYQSSRNKRNYLNLMEILVNYNNYYSKNKFIDLIKVKGIKVGYGNIVWDLIRKEEKKLNKNLITDLNRLKKIFLEKTRELSNHSDGYTNICGYMDYYALLRIFVKYSDEKLAREKTFKHGATPLKCRNINSNENIIYYCGGYHTILIYKILNEYFNKYPVMFGYYDLNENRRNITNKISIDNMEKYDGRILNLFEIFEM